MLSFFRRFFQSKIGLPIFLGFLVLMALAFVAADIGGTSFSGFGAGDKVAVVEGDPVPPTEVVSAARAALDRVRQQAPTLTMEEFVEQGALDEVMDQIIDRMAVSAFAKAQGLRAGENLVNSEILKLDAFRGPTGEFDEKIYRAALAQRGISDALLRRDLTAGLLEQQLLRPAIAAPRMPEKIARRYASLVLERRKGEIALIPSSAFAPAADPSPAELGAWYEANRTRFIRPERRVLRFAVFGADTIKAQPAPAAAEIATRFQRDAARYQASERRAISSFVVPTQDAAKALAARVRGGTSLEAAARAAGFSASRTELRTREDLGNATSFAFAQNAFKTPEGALVEPTQGTLGWLVARVDKIERTPARSLAEATPEITAQLAAEKRAAAVAQLTSTIEEEVDGGTALAEVAKSYGLKVETTPALLANGRGADDPRVQIKPQLQPILAAAFQMEESEPQLAVIAEGEQYVVFDVARITEAAAAPLAEVREVALAGWKRAQGAKTARAAADRVLAKVRAGTPLAAALAAEQRPGIERQSVDLARREVLARQQGNLPPALALLFSMAEGSEKVLEAPRDIGWFVVALDDISSEPVDKEPQLVAETMRQLSPTLGAEYRSAVAAAIRDASTITRNKEALAAVRAQLVGEQP